VTSGGTVIAAAMRTPPHNVILLSHDERAVDLIVDDLLAVAPDLTGVIGDKRAALRAGEVMEDQEIRQQVAAQPALPRCIEMFPRPTQRAPARSCRRARSAPGGGRHVTWNGNVRQIPGAVCIREHHVTPKEVHADATLGRLEPAERRVLIVSLDGADSFGRITCRAGR
jgi:hypothetical protein